MRYTAFGSLLLVLLFCLSSLYLPPALAGNTPVEGSIFPDLKLALPQRLEEREYLRVDSGPFPLSRIRTEILIVEIFNMYCPHCQKDAPNVNALHQAIADNPKLRSRIKLIGIGVGNSPFEVNAFRNIYRVPFPLIADEDRSIHEALGNIGTPYFFVLWNKRGGRRVVIYSKAGTIGNPGEFLDLIAAKTGRGGGK